MRKEKHFIDIVRLVLFSIRVQTNACKSIKIIIISVAQVFISTLLWAVAVWMLYQRCCFVQAYLTLHSNKFDILLHYIVQYEVQTQFDTFLTTNYVSTVNQQIFEAKDFCVLSDYHDFIQHSKQPSRVFLLFLLDPKNPQKNAKRNQSTIFPSITWNKQRKEGHCSIFEHSLWFRKTRPALITSKLGQL